MAIFKEIDDVNLSNSAVHREELIKQMEVQQGEKDVYKNSWERARKLAAIDMLELAEERLRQSNEADSTTTKPEKAEQARRSAEAQERAQSKPQTAEKKPEAQKQDSMPFALRGMLNRRLGEDSDREKMFHPDSRARKLCEKVKGYMTVPAVNHLYQMQKFTPEAAENARRQMAEMVAVELLIQEKRGEPYGLEDELNKMHAADFVDCIENLPIFREKTKHVTPQSFSQFIAGRGDREIRNELLRSIIQEQKDANGKEKKAPGPGESRKYVQKDAKNPEQKETEHKEPEQKTLKKKEKSAVLVK